MIFQLENVDLGYENIIVANNLSFSVEEGNYLCIVGENGTGKSTLIKALLGLIRPMNGKIFVDKKQKGIGYLPQQTNAQRDFPASVWEVVLSGNLNGKSFKAFYSKRDKIQASQNMEKFKITEFKNKCYRELSGGLQQRVLLARAMCATDSVLILDEPVTGLDPSASTELYETIKSLNEKENVTVIMVTHDVENAMDYATHILHLKQDSYFFGTVDEYKKSNVSNMFLGDTVINRIHHADDRNNKDIADTIAKRMAGDGGNES